MGHPGLLPPDPCLRGIHTDRVASYDPGAVEAVLGRLSAVALRMAGGRRPRGLVTVAQGLRRGAIKPWYKKTDFLLDVFAGALPVFTAAERPRLRNLWVDDAALKRRSATRQVLRDLDGAPHVRWNRANTVIAAAFGPHAALSPQDYRRLADAGLVRCSTRAVQRPDRDTLRTMRLYRLDDVIAYAEARFVQGRDPLAAGAPGGGRPVRTRVGGHAAGVDPEEGPSAPPATGRARAASHGAASAPHGRRRAGRT